MSEVSCNEKRVCIQEHLKSQQHSLWQSARWRGYGPALQYSLQTFALILGRLSCCEQSDFPFFRSLHEFSCLSCSMSRQKKKEKKSFSHNSLNELKKKTNHTNATNSFQKMTTNILFSSFIRETWFVNRLKVVKRLC